MRCSLESQAPSLPTEGTSAPMASSGMFSALRILTNSYKRDVVWSVGGARGWWWGVGSRKEGKDLMWQLPGLAPDLATK